MCFKYMAFQHNILIACNILVKKQVQWVSEYAELLNELRRRKRITSFLRTTLGAVWNLYKAACVTIGRNVKFTAPSNVHK